MKKKAPSKASKPGKKRAPVTSNAASGTPAFVIAIGASAGGLEALQEFLSGFPADIKNVSIIIAQHLSTTHKSLLVPLLRRNTKMPVNNARQGTKLLAGHVYVTPLDTEIAVAEGKFQLQTPKKSFSPKPSIDHLFQSLATDLRHKVIGVILSGTGADGSKGIRDIQKAGGVVMVQDPLSAKYDGMPMAAIETDQVHFILPPSEMGKKIKEIISNPSKSVKKPAEPYPVPTPIERLFKLLQKRTGTNFSGYKKNSVCRRLEKRLEITGIPNLEKYLEYIQKKPEELDALFESCLIGVTAFFRDKDAFESLRKQLSPIIREKPPGEAVRIWCAGCSNGEEAYTLAIIVQGLLKDHRQQRQIQIFATDVNEKAISYARQASYPAEALKGLSKPIIDSCFVKKGNHYEVEKSIRNMVLFSKHDLTNNPPFIKLDLITCRNLLIYFNPALQQHVFPVLHYALNPKGLLMLGKSESVGQFSDLFSILDKKNKIYQRKRGGAIHSLRFSTLRPQNPALISTQVKKERIGLSVAEMVKETLFSGFEHPYVVINDNFDLQEIYGDVSPFLSLQAGLMNASVVKLVNKELRTELRAAISKSIRDKRTERTSIKRYNLGNRNLYLRMMVKPMLSGSGDIDLYLVVFEKIDLGDLLERHTENAAGEKKDAAYRELENELASTTEHLQTYIEELETSNEELQSLNEELQSTNEELQSTSEELETSNEELQSANEEIQISYAELRNTHEELEKKSALLREKEASQFALLNNTLQGFILVSSNYTILALNKRAKQIIKSAFLKNINAGESVINAFDQPGIASFIAELTKAIGGKSFTTEKNILTPDGKSHWLSFSFTPVKGEDGKITVLSIGILDITENKKAEQLIKDSTVQLHQLTQYLHNIREEERTRIGSKVHDELGQQLTVLKMGISWLNGKLSGADEAIRKRIAELLEMLDAMISSVRKICAELRPSLLDDMGLTEAMEWYLGEFEKSTGVKGQFRSPAQPLQLSNPIRTTLFRIFQESLSNVARHAKATRADVRLQKKGNIITLSVKDNGNGFDPTVHTPRKTLGILEIEERSIELGGKCRIVSKAGEGTTVTVSIPVDAK